MKNKVRAIVAEKKIYVLLLLLCSNVMMFADGLTATLQHGTTMTAYFGQSALQSAYEAAADGDIITLSPGGFNPVTDIAKSVRIVGAYGVTSTAYTTFLNAAFTISADNVKLEGMYFQSAVTLGAIKNCTIKRCYIESLQQSGTHTNTLIDQCVLKYDYAVETGVNYGIKNTTIQCFRAMNTTDNVANITNCMIWYFVWSGTYTRPYAVYKNNILGLRASGSTTYAYSENSPSEYYNNYLFRLNSSTTGYVSSLLFAAGCINSGNTYSGNTSITSYTETYPNKMAITLNEEVVGITGGEGFNEYPAIPRVLTASIDAQTDDKGKLNASITVQAEK